MTTHDFDFDPEGNRSYGSGIVVVVMMVVVVVVVKLCTPMDLFVRDESRLGCLTTPGRNSRQEWH